MKDILIILEQLDDLEKEEKSYLRDLKIADIISQLEVLLGA